jgi:hypothetical protein
MTSIPLWCRSLGALRAPFCQRLCRPFLGEVISNVVPDHFPIREFLLCYKATSRILVPPLANDVINDFSFLSARAQAKVPPILLDQLPKRNVATVGKTVSTHRTSKPTLKRASTSPYLWQLDSPPRPSMTVCMSAGELYCQKRSNLNDLLVPYHRAFQDT